VLLYERLCLRHLLRSLLALWHTGASCLHTILQLMHHTRLPHSGISIRPRLLLLASPCLSASSTGTGPICRLLLLLLLLESAVLELF
jgi:hypothetical protein